MAIASEVLFYPRESTLEVAMLKLDFEKAFDNLDWDFLLKTLEAKFSNGKWITWINVWLESSYASCLINGHLSNSFKICRDLYQGYSLSPMLFILAVDVLDALIRRFSIIGLLEGTCPKNSWQVINRHFVDDSLFLFQAKVVQIFILRTILLCFEDAAGLKIDLQKSSMYYLGQEADLDSRLAKLMQCTSTELPFTYFSVPVMNKHLPKEVWQSLIEIRMRLFSLEDFLSQVGSMVLVNSILSMIPLYLMSLYLLPKWVIKDIE